MNMNTWSISFLHRLKLEIKFIQVSISHCPFPPFWLIQLRFFISFTTKKTTLSFHTSKNIRQTSFHHSSSFLLKYILLYSSTHLTKFHPTSPQLQLEWRQCEGFSSHWRVSFASFKWHIFFRPTNCSFADLSGKYIWLPCSLHYQSNHQIIIQTSSPIITHHLSSKTFTLLLLYSYYLMTRGIC